LDRLWELIHAPYPGDEQVVELVGPFIDPDTGDWFDGRREVELCWLPACSMKFDADSDIEQEIVDRLREVAQAMNDAADRISRGVA
jgi:hypothetical protein